MRWIKEPLLEETINKLISVVYHKYSQYVMPLCDDFASTLDGKMFLIAAAYLRKKMKEKNVSCQVVPSFGNIYCPIVPNATDPIAVLDLFSNTVTVGKMEFCVYDRPFIHTVIGEPDGILRIKKVKEGRFPARHCIFCENNERCLILDIIHKANDTYRVIPTSNKEEQNTVINALLSIQKELFKYPLLSPQCGLRRKLLMDMNRIHPVELVMSALVAAVMETVNAPIDTPAVITVGSFLLMPVGYDTFPILQDHDPTKKLEWNAYPPKEYEDLIKYFSKQVGSKILCLMLSPIRRPVVLGVSDAPIDESVVNSFIEMKGRKSQFCSYCEFFRRCSETIIPETVESFAVSFPITTLRLVTPLHIVNPTTGEKEVVNSFVDTGSPITLISESIAQSLKLPQIGVINLAGIGGKTKANLYACRISIDGKDFFEMEVGTLNRPIDGYEALVGMDFFKKGNMRAVTFE